MTAELPPFTSFEFLHIPGGIEYTTPPDLLPFDALRFAVNAKRLNRYPLVGGQVQGVKDGLPMHSAVLEVARSGEGVTVWQSLTLLSRRGRTKTKEWKDRLPRSPWVAIGVPPQKITDGRGVLYGLVRHQMSTYAVDEAIPLPSLTLR